MRLTTVRTPVRLPRVVVAASCLLPVWPLQVQDPPSQSVTVEGDAANELELGQYQGRHSKPSKYFPSHNLTHYEQEARDGLQAAKRRYRAQQQDSPLKRELAVVALGSLSTTPFVQARMDLLEVYRPHFGHMVFLGLGDQFAEDANLTRWSCRTYFQVYWAPYQCVGHLLDKFAERGEAERFQGLTFFHFDFWLHPAHLHGLLAANADLLAGVFGGFDPAMRRDTRPQLDLAGYECAATEELFYQMPWVQENVRYLMLKPEGTSKLLGVFNHIDVAAMRGLSRADDSKLDKLRQLGLKRRITSSGTAGPLCFGWADMYRVPRSLWSTFSAMSRLFEPLIKDKREAFHEVVVPTMLQRMAAASGKSLAMVPCWGGALHISRDPWFLETLPCGHRMDLAQEEVRQGFAAALSAD